MAAFTKTFPVSLGEWVYRPTGNKYASKWKVMYIGFSEAGTFFHLASEDGKSSMSTELSRLGISWFLTRKEAEEYIKEKGARRSKY